MTRNGLLVTVLISTAGCYGGDYGQRFRSSDSDSPTELEWLHRWEPRQFLVYKTCHGQFEALTLLVDPEPVGKRLAVGGGVAVSRYEHGAAMNPCDKAHRVEGTVTIVERSEKRVLASLDVFLICHDEERRALKGEYSFERKHGASR